MLAIDRTGPRIAVAALVAFVLARSTVVGSTEPDQRPIDVSLFVDTSDSMKNRAGSTFEALDAALNHFPPAARLRTIFVGTDTRGAKAHVSQVPKSSDRSRTASTVHAWAIEEIAFIRAFLKTQANVDRTCILDSIRRVHEAVDRVADVPHRLAAVYVSDMEEDCGKPEPTTCKPTAKEETVLSAPCIDDIVQTQLGTGARSEYRLEGVKIVVCEPPTDGEPSKDSQKSGWLANRLHATPVRHDFWRRVFSQLGASVEFTGSVGCGAATQKALGLQAAVSHHRVVRSAADYHVIEERDAVQIAEALPAPRQ